MQRLVLALSLAHLIYLRAWFDLLAEHTDEFHTRHRVASWNFEALLVNVMVLAALAWLGLRFGSRVPLWLRTVGVAVPVAFAGNAVRATASVYLPLLRSGAFNVASPKVIAAVAVTAFGAFVLLLFRRFALTTAALAGFLLVCAPLVPLVDGLAAFRLMAERLPVAQPALTAPAVAEASAGPRVVWVIFDEWDQRLSFEARPGRVSLAALDALAARSFVGTHVLGPEGRIPVSQMATQAAIPSLLAGKLRGADNFAGPNLISTVHQRGLNVAVGGWHLPYCRLFAADAYRCDWDQMYTQSNTYGNSFAEALRVQSRSLLETSMFSVFGQSETSARHAAEYRELLAFGESVVADPRASLVFLHFNIPHTPFFYDAGRDRFDAPGRPLPVAYADALQLVDRTVAKLVERLDQRTILILSSDHPLRVAAQVDGVTDPRVPFLIHFPGQEESRREGREFSSLRTAELVLEMLEGRVRTGKEAGRFLIESGAPHGRP